MLSLLLVRGAAAIDEWVPIGPAGESVRGLATDPSNSQIIYAGTTGGRLYKTTDGGTTWNVVLFVGSGIQAVGIDPQVPQNVFAGAGIGLFKSPNGGNNWFPATNLILAAAFVDDFAEGQRAYLDKAK